MCTELGSTYRYPVGNINEDTVSEVSNDKKSTNDQKVATKKKEEDTPKFDSNGNSPPMKKQKLSEAGPTQVQLFTEVANVS